MVDSIPRVEDIDPALADLELPELWRQFTRYAKSSTSLHEAGVGSLATLASDRGGPAGPTAGNIVLRVLAAVPASLANPGVQGHMDMVCESPAKPARLYRDRSPAS
jgi:hypothetical protein